MRQRKRWAPAPRGINNDHAELKHSKSVLEAWETPNRKDKPRGLFEPVLRQEEPEDEDVFEKAMKEQNQQLPSPKEELESDPILKLL